MNEYSIQYNALTDIPSASCVIDIGAGAAKFNSSAPRCIQEVLSGFESTILRLSSVHSTTIPLGRGWDILYCVALLSIVFYCVALLRILLWLMSTLLYCEHCNVLQLVVADVCCNVLQLVLCVMFTLLYCEHCNVLQLVVADMFCNVLQLVLCVMSTLLYCEHCNVLQLVVADVCCNVLQLVVADVCCNVLQLVVLWLLCVVMYCSWSCVLCLHCCIVFYAMSCSWLWLMSTDTSFTVCLRCRINLVTSLSVMTSLCKYILLLISVLLRNIPIAV